jgi:putative ergosteryl-3beta-O-L-aspartate hydrolase
MGIGMFLHRTAPPRPPKPDFYRTIPSTISGKPGNINLVFYVPMGYDTQRKLWQGRSNDAEADEDGAPSEEDVKKGKQRRVSSIGAIGQEIRRRTSSAKKWQKYPVVINFHGGGFTLGTPKDDSRWCSTVVDECNAVVVSVDYRLAPECPFPTAVEDGVDAVIWVHQHAAELGIDKDKIALSGFSSGGNMAFTVPLRLWDEMMGFPRDEDESNRPASPPNPFTSGASSPASSKAGPPNQVEILDPSKPPPPMPNQPNKSGTQVSEAALRQISDISLRAIVPWYPSLDYTRTRAQRRDTSLRKDQDLPAIFTDLFDESYLHPPDSISLDSPYLSPGIAPTSLLKNALPQEIIMHTCEWDMLLDEGQTFRDRLLSPEIGKKVNYTMIKGVPHGWDKAPNPLKPTPGVKEHYLAACKELRRIFGETGLKERKTEEGGWSAAPRGSVSVVR